MHLYAFTIGIPYMHSLYAFKNFILYTFTISIHYLHSLYAFTICIHYMHSLYAFNICIHYMHSLYALCTLYSVLCTLYSVVALHCLNPCRELSPAQREVEQQQYRTSLNQLFVQHKCTVMLKIFFNFLSCPQQVYPIKG